MEQCKWHNTIEHLKAHESFSNAYKNLVCIGMYAHENSRNWAFTIWKVWLFNYSPNEAFCSCNCEQQNYPGHNFLVQLVRENFARMFSSWLEDEGQHSEYINRITLYLSLPICRHSFFSHLAYNLWRVRLHFYNNIAFCIFQWLKVVVYRHSQHVTLQKCQMLFLLHAGLGMSPVLLVM